MEHELHLSSRPLSERLQLPKGALEAGLSRESADTTAKKRRAARLSMAAEVSRPDGDSVPSGRRSEAVSAWRRLTGRQVEVGPAAAPRRQAEDARPLEGDGEIQLQSAPAPLEHMTNAMAFPTERIQTPDTDDRPPNMPPPIQSWMGESSPAAKPAAADIVPLATAAATVEQRQSRPHEGWLRGDTAATTPTAEVLAAQPLTELLAAPAAAVALKTGAESMTTPRMLELARTIVIDGTPLSEYYNAKQVDEAGLRAVIEAYLRGGDAAAQLQQEIVDKQIQFERDPYSRKHHRDEPQSRLRSVSGRVADAAGAVVKTAGSVAGKASQSLAQGAKQAKHTAHDGSEARQWVGIGAVVVIWAIILMLVLG